MFKCTICNQEKYDITDEPICYDCATGDADDKKKIAIAKEFCELIIKHYETDKLYIKDPFAECYELAKKTLKKLI